ncbi:hypothetical protein CLOM_g1884 [Closterium sp. NIES-68]|nr:hypothetical protein CLOM_g1884 [Closterium sp. NIES-68]GJP84499.1 hypothetical protein CLOP_g14562 [Closterium sp. NIES-67]
MAPDAPAPINVIINASPGIDDTLAILAALKCPTIRVLGIATSFSHYVTCEAATRNARGLCIAAGRPDTPVVQGATAPLSTAPHPGLNTPETTATASSSSSTLNTSSLPSRSSFLGPDGLAGVLLPPVSTESGQGGKPARGITGSLASTHIAAANVGDGSGRDGGEQLNAQEDSAQKGAEDNAQEGAEQRACEWVCEEVARRPGQITIMQLGPMTNLAQALSLRPSLASEVAAIWVVGGSFFASGDVNAAAEESVFADPEAADQVLTSGANIHVLGLNVTTRVTLTGSDLSSLCSEVASPAAHDATTSPAAAAAPSLVARLVQAYASHHKQSDHMDGIFLHDACAVAAILDPSLFSFKPGSVRVETTGVARGCTLMDYSLKNWNGPNPWVGVPPVHVAMAVDTAKVAATITQLLAAVR